MCTDDGLSHSTKLDPFPNPYNNSYRGHNELDEPAFTQPVMYQQIRSRQSVPTLYEEQLIVSSQLHRLRSSLTSKRQSENVITRESAKSLRESYKAYLNDELTQADSFVPSAHMLEKQWSGLVWPASEEADRNPDTGVDQDALVRIGRASVDVPEGFVGLRDKCFVM